MRLSVSPYTCATGDAVITTDTGCATTRLLASIVESSNDAIIGMSLDGTIRSWNAAAERIYGYPEAKAVGADISIIVPPGRRDEQAGIIARLSAGERLEHFETERLHRDGRTIQVSVTVSPIRDQAGNVVGASKIAHDVSERRRLEETLRALASELSDADRRKDEFLATLAHELRNPLAPLNNSLLLLKHVGARDGALLHQAIDTMERQVRQLVRLVDDLLDVSRITRGRLELRKEDVELGAIIEQALHASAPLARLARHDVRVTKPASPIHLHADSARLSQVFANLLNNSCKYTPPGGTINVVVERRGNWVEVSVEDTGIGIPQDRLGDIFEPFMQVDRSAASSHDGLGIGLALVHRLVTMHDGSVEAHSAGKGQGSRFVVRLPATEDAARATTVVDAHDSAVGNGAAVSSRRILVVDDNEDAADTLAMLLEIHGHRTATAHDGVAALELVEAFDPEFVLLDIGMPAMDGHEVCRRLRKCPRGRGMVVVALTGWGQEADRRRSREAGFDGHLTKPVDVDTLAALFAPRAA